MAKKLRHYWTALANTWARLQIELNGEYSATRLGRLREYSERTSIAHCVLVLLLTPLPCLLIVVLLECIPLRSPSDGLECSLLLWIRTSILISMITICSIWQSRFFVPRLPSSTSPILVVPIVFAVGSVAGTFGVARFVGFPLPFTLVVQSGLYLLAAYHLPNRVFLATTRDIPFEELSNNILGLLGFSLLEIASLVALTVLLQRRTGVSALHQLAFVLETEWQLVQTNMLSWIVLAVQAPLEHYGVDFSFRFAWLKGN